MQPYATELSLILPCYNSLSILQQQLPQVLFYLQQHFSTYEVILVDDGSEKSQDIRVFATEQSCRCIVLPHNKGKGAALRTGFQHATGRVQVFLDADIPFEPDVIGTMYRLIAAGAADLVIGDRTAAGSVYYMQVSPLRKAGSFFISGIAKRILQSDIRDTQCGVKGFSATAATALFPVSIIDGFGIDVEILYLASLQNMSILKVPVKLRAVHPSSVRIVRDGMKLIMDIFSAIRYHGRKKL